LKKGRRLIENVFGLLKHTFCELLVKSDLDVTFLYNVITYCCLLRNLLLGQSIEDVERLLDLFCREGMELEIFNNDEPTVEASEIPLKGLEVHLEAEKRRSLGLYLRAHHGL
jgi:pentatricopeptide repeat protein